MSVNYEMAYVSLDGPISDVLNREGIQHISVNKISRSEIKRAVKMWRPDVIHAHDFTTSIISATIFSGEKIISHLHHNPNWLNKLNIRTIVYLLASLRISKILCVSPAVLEEYFFSDLVQKKSLILSNTVDSDRVIRLSQLDKLDQQYDIAFVGRLSESKDPLRFISILAQIYKNYPSVKAIMIGNGELVSFCKDKIIEMGLGENLIMFGFMENPFSVIKNAQFLIMPSKWEGYGLVAVEAMILGKPVLATPVGGLKSIVNNECGALCTTDEDFIYMSERLINDKPYYTRLSIGASNRAAEMTKINGYIERLSAVYEDLFYEGVE
jgi:glycosyltransferase involved in cell wall biosynthesis